MAALAPLPGFDWTKVSWGGPDETQSLQCSYCGDELSDDEVALILSTETGWVAKFCTFCQMTHWGFQIYEEPPFDDGDDYGEGDDVG